MPIILALWKQRQEDPWNLLITPASLAKSVSSRFKVPELKRRYSDVIKTAEIHVHKQTHMHTQIYAIFIPHFSDTWYQSILQLFHTTPVSPSVIYSTNYFLSLSVIHHALRPESGQYPQTKMYPGSDSSQTQTLLFLYIMLQGRFSCDTNPWSPRLPSFPHPSNLICAWAPGPASFHPSSEDSSSYLGSDRNWGSGG